MIFVTGPLYAGKRAYLRTALGLSEAELADRAVWDVQDMVANAPPEALAERLAVEYDIVIATEVGGGVVPVDALQRAQREAAGRLACLLAERAEVVLRVCCGLPQVLKGEWKCASS